MYVFLILIRSKMLVQNEKVHAKNRNYGLEIMLLNSSFVSIVPIVSLLIEKKNYRFFKHIYR